MKKVYLCLLAGASLALASCSSDDLTTVGGGSDNGGGSTSTGIPSSDLTVPMDNWKKARISVKSPVNTLVSLSYNTEGEGETVIVSDYVATKGSNDIDVTIPAYVEDVTLTYTTTDGAEETVTAALDKSLVSLEGTLSNYTDSEGKTWESVPFRVRYEVGGETPTFHEHWTQSGNGDWMLTIHYMVCDEWENEKIVEIQNPGIDVGGGDEGNIDGGEIDLEGIDNVEQFYTDDAEGNLTYQGTTYNTSGVVMFDANWPYNTDYNSEFISKNYGRFDYNDVVVDYNIQSLIIDYDKTGNAEYFAANAYKEGITVTMHVRAVGHTSPTEVGLKLEGIDATYFSNMADLQSGEGVEIYLAGGQGRQYEVPEGSLSAKVETDGGCPVIKIDGLQYLNSDEWRQSQYVLNDSAKMDGVLYNVERYTKLYWLATGEDRVNRTGPLFTVKVHFSGNRAAVYDNNAALSAAMVKTFINGAKSANQNFFITLPGREIHVGGFAPLTSFESSYNNLKNNATWGKNFTDEYYIAPNGCVWGVKAPVLVKHIYEGENFAATYKEFSKWIESKGEDAKDWYDTGKFNAQCDDTNLVTYW